MLHVRNTLVAAASEVASPWCNC
ncbi:MAG: hypothetical protein R2709_06820 [Marmoricola sp.]